MSVSKAELGGDEGRGRVVNVDSSGWTSEL